MTDNRVLAWHFTGSTLRDGRPIPAVGETLRHTEPLVMCRSGYHGSVRLVDALSYAPGSTLHRVVLGGEHLVDTDKVCAWERTILWTLPAEVMEPILHEFACWCAERALAMIPSPDPRSVEAIRVKRAWMRGEATAIQLAAAGDASWAASWVAAGAASWAVSWAAALAASGDAAVAASRAATWAAAVAASRDAAVATSRAVTWKASWAVAEAVAGAAEVAAQDRRLTELVVLAAGGMGIEVDAEAIREATA